MGRLGGRDFSFIALLILVSVAFLWLLLPFYGALLWALIMAVLFDPLHRRLVRNFRGRENLAAATTLAICICIVVIPGSLLLAVLTREATSFYHHIGERDLDPSAIIDHIQSALPGALIDLVGTIESLRERVMSLTTEAARAAATHLVSIGQGTARLFISVGLMLYVLFFLFRDGTRLAATIRRASPLSEHQTGCVMDRFTRVLKATVKGNFIIALIQGTLGGIAFWALGIDGALLWGVVMVVLSLLPAIGAALVWVPAAVYLLLAGQYIRGGILLAVGALIISMIDNFLRPLLVGNEIRVPDYLVLVSTLGGLAVFGLNGFVVGPLIAAVFVAVWSLLDEERE